MKTLFKQTSLACTLLMGATAMTFAPEVKLWAASTTIDS